MSEKYFLPEVFIKLTSLSILRNSKLAVAQLRLQVLENPFQAKFHYILHIFPLQRNKHGFFKKGRYDFYLKIFVCNGSLTSVRANIQRGLSYNVM
jgi:hypothetical protein